jgi:hypothetical protein
MKGCKGIIAAGAVLAWLLAYVAPVACQEVKPSYTEEGLAEVREWEKTWAGKEVDSTNIDQMAEMLPEGWVRVIRNPNEWHMDRFWFTIRPYERIVLSKGMAEATQKHAAIAKIDEEGLLETFTTEAGWPFPNPETGEQVAWNLHFNNMGETYFTEMKGAPVDTRTGSERFSHTDRWYMWFAARTERDPKPLYPKKKNKRNMRWAYVHHFYHPPETADNRFLHVRYNTHDKHDDSWLWLSQFRRIRRYVATQKMDTIDGTDQAYEDGYDFNNHIQVNTYKLLGRKDMLVVRHNDHSTWAHKDGEPFYNGLERERVKTYVVEATPKNKSHVYSKRIWYIDPEFLLIAHEEKYDKLGRYWRSYESFFEPVKSQLDETVMFFAGNNQADMERVHGGFSKSILREMGLEISPKLFTLTGLRKGGY